MSAAASMPLSALLDGIGVVPADRPAARAASIRPGDAVLLSGTLGDHGIAVLAARGDLALQAEIRSDTAPLNHLVEAMYATGGEITALRDPTRGGLAAACTEIARSAGLDLRIDADAVPVVPGVRAATEILGLDPMHLACEGRLVAFVAPQDADRALRGLQELDASAARIGDVLPGTGRVWLRDSFGGERLLDLPLGDPLPRIC